MTTNTHTLQIEEILELLPHRFPFLLVDRVLDFEEFTPVAGYSFLVFNLLCAPCCAAMSAIRREMNSAKWTLFAIGYQCVFAYAVSFMIYQFGMLFIGQADILGVIVAVVVLGFMIYMLVRPQKKYNKPTVRAVDA